MSAPRSGRFAADELLGADGFRADDRDAAGIAAIAAEFEALAAEAPVRVTAEFTERVGAAIAAEPTPAPAVAARASIGRHSLGGFLAALGDSRRVAFGAGRPLLMRGQAFALLLVVILGVLSAGGAAAVGAAQLLAPAPAPQQQATPTITPSPTIKSTPTITLSPTTSPSPSQPPSIEPIETPDPNASQGGGEQPGQTAEPDGESPRPSGTPKPSDMLEPGETPKPSDSDASGQSQGAGAEHTP